MYKDSNLRFGLIGYRDRGDKYITKLYPLTDEFDHIFISLREFTADGGGDFPESVNQALFESIHLMKWSKSSNAKKFIFLVGVAPPHMNYQDDIPYFKSCIDAKKSGIIINTLQCDQDEETSKVWKEIAKCTDGEFGILSNEDLIETIISTPYDEKINDLQKNLMNTGIVYKDEDVENVEKLSKGLDDYGSSVRSDYASFSFLRSGGPKKLSRVYKGDILSDFEEGILPEEKLEDENIQRIFEVKNKDELLEKMNLKKEERIDIQKELQSII